MPWRARWTAYAPDGPPALPANLLGDCAGGSLCLTTGVLAALLTARATGRGQAVDAAVVDGTAHLTTMSLPALDGDGLPARADPRNWPALRAAFTTRFKSTTREEWTAVFEGSDACAAPALSLHEAAGHRQRAGRGTYTEAYGITQPAPAPRFSDTPGTLRLPPALPGAHTPDVARAWDVPELLKEHR